MKLVLIFILCFQWFRQCIDVTDIEVTEAPSAPRADHRLHDPPTERVPLPAFRPRLRSCPGSVCLPGRHCRASPFLGLRWAPLSHALQPRRFW